MKSIEIDTPIEEMDDESLRATFSAVLEAHNENVAEYATFSARVEELESENERLAGQVEQAKAHFAASASELTTLDADLLAARFSLDELIEMAGKAAQFAQEAVEADAEEEAPEADAEGEAAEEGAETVFADRPDRAPVPTDADAKFRQAARDRLKNIPGLAFE
jgi:chromosome segregation ATPase